MKPRFLTLVLLLFSSFIFAQDAELPSEKHKGKFKEAVRLPFHFLRLSLKKVDSYKFQEYSYGEHKRQYMLICHPQDKNWKTDEIVFFFHGGGWHVGSPEQNRYLAALLASYGYTVVMPAYRLGPKFCYEDIQADIDSVIVKGLEVLGDDYAQGKNIILGGTSAGGHLAALLAYDNQRLKRLGLNSERIKGFFAIASPLDLDFMSETKVAHTYAGEPHMVTFQMANPINLVDEKDNFPALFLHGKQDGLVDYRSTLSFAEIMECKGLCPKVRILDDLTHLETTTRWYYKDKADIGQGEMLLLWLLAL